MSDSSESLLEVTETRSLCRAEEEAEQASEASSFPARRQESCRLLRLAALPAALLLAGILAAATWMGGITALSPPGSSSANVEGEEFLYKKHGHHKKHHHRKAESSAPMYDFYMYRIQSAQDYSPENQNMGNIGGVLWYLHSEIVWHHWIRAGSFSSNAKTRIERFRVKTRATEKMYQRGMNFGVVNTFDLGKCTGPFTCENIAFYGPNVGCESWTESTEHKLQRKQDEKEGKATKHGNNFPHQMWLGVNHYPKSVWYSLPGSCSSMSYWNHTEECEKQEPSGRCPAHIEEPTGARDCSYTYEKVGEISINELEGIDSFDKFIKEGKKEYVRRTDHGVGMNFWDLKNSSTACQMRIDRVEAVFKAKYIQQPDLPDPVCDFDTEKFFPSECLATGASPTTCRFGS